MTKEQVTVMINFLRLVLFGFSLLFIECRVKSEYQDEFTRREKLLEDGLMDAFGYHRV